MITCPYLLAIRRCRRLLERELSKDELTAILAALDLRGVVIVHDAKLKILRKIPPSPSK
jgi:hypothetical protein